MKKVFKMLLASLAFLLLLVHFNFSQEGPAGIIGKSNAYLPGTSIKYSGMIVGDMDNDGVEEAACDFGTAGIWLYDENYSPKWTKISNQDPDSMIALDYDGDGETEVLAAYLAGNGSIELWNWQLGNQAGTWSTVGSGWHTAWMLAADVDGDGNHEAIVQMTHNSGSPQQLWIEDDITGWELIFNGVTEGGVRVAFGAPDDEVVVQVDGGNLQWWNHVSWVDPDFTDQWTVMSTSWCEIVDCRAGEIDGDAEEEFVGDFVGGMWAYNWSSTPKWQKLHQSGVGDLHIEDIVGDTKGEIFPDFSTTWYYEWGVGWTKISSNSYTDWPVSTHNGLVDGGGKKEVAFDFASSGLWLYDANAAGAKWQRLTPSNPQAMVEINFDGAAASELFVDFGSAGLWRYDPALSPAWKRISTSNVEQN